MSGTSSSSSSGAFSGNSGSLMTTLIDAGLSLYSDAKNREFNAEEAAKNREFQRSERLAAQDFNTEMWNLNNEYNDLASQLERAELAGVNANSFLSKGGNPSSVSSPVTTTPMSGSQASYASSLPAALSNLTAGHSKTMTEVKFDKLSMSARLELLNTEISKNKEFTALTSAQKAGVLETNKWIAKQESVKLDTMFAQLDEYKSKISLLDAQTETEKERKELVDAQTFTEISRDGLLEEQISGQQTENEIKEEELKQAKLRNGFSDITKIPYGTPEFEFAYWLWQNDEFENYCGMLAAEAVSSDGGKWVMDIISGILSLFGKGKKMGKRTTTHTYSPKGTTISESTTIPI